MNTVTTKNASDAAVIVLANIVPQILQHRMNATKLGLAREPLMVFHRNRPLICAVGKGKFSDLFSISKSSALTNEEIDRL